MASLVSGPDCHEAASWAAILGPSMGLQLIAAYLVAASCRVSGVTGYTPHVTSQGLCLSSPAFVSFRCSGQYLAGRTLKLGGKYPFNPAETGGHTSVSPVSGFWVF